VKIYKSAYLFALPLLMFSCEPVAFDTTDDEPVFTSEITIGGEDFSFAAGVDDYVMMTEVLTLGPYLNYSGNLQHKNDPAGHEQFRIGFRFSEVSRNAIDPDHLESFKVGDYAYRTIDPALLPSPEVSFRSTYAGSGTNVDYNWDFGDGAEVNFKDPIHSYPSIMNSYVSTLTTTDENQCVASVAQTVTFDDTEDISSTIDVISINNNNAVLEANPSGTAPFTYLWFDESSESDIAIDIADSNDNQQFCVTITDANDLSSVNCIGVIKDGNGNVQNCSASIIETNFPNARLAVQFDAVEVDWNNGIAGSAGLQVTSDEVIQDDDSFFRILAFEEFERNDRGERTVKFEYELKAILYETLGTGPIPIEANGTMAVAIPD